MHIVAADNAFQAGRSAGTVVGLLLAFVCIGLGASAHDKPGTNRNAAMSIILIGFALLIVQLFSVYLLMNEAPPGAVVATLLVLADLALVIPAIVLALKGWMEMSHEPAHFTRGKGFIRASLTLSALHIVAIAIGLFAGLARFGHSVAPLPEDQQPIAGETIKFDGLGFELDAPTPAWKRYDGAAFDHAIVAMMRSNPGITFLLHVNTVGANFPLDYLADRAKSSMRSAMAEYEFVKEYHRTLNGMDGICICSRETAATHNVPIYSVEWVSSDQNRVYLLSMCGDPSDSDDVDDAADKMFARFHHQDDGQSASHAVRSARAGGGAGNELEASADR